MHDEDKRTSLAVRVRVRVLVLVLALAVQHEWFDGSVLVLVPSVTSNARPCCWPFLFSIASAASAARAIVF